MVRKYVCARQGTKERSVRILLGNLVRERKRTYDIELKLFDMTVALPVLVVLEQPEGTGKPVVCCAL